MPISINRPKHLDLPDEVTRDGRLVHVYYANPNGKHLIESLLWLLSYYNIVELDGDKMELVCSGHFMKMEIESDKESD